MKGLVKKVESFIMFDFPLETANITAQFAATQQKSRTEMSGWSTSATRQKLISHYWFTYVMRHFALMLGLPVVIFLFSGNLATISIEHFHDGIVKFSCIVPVSLPSQFWFRLFTTAGNS